ncbi:MAG: hypothetical protein ISP91_11435 [Pseudomonadales bacterium]|jgi:hypothetical protein|nr:hypothetical protein [Pseudomonadales bacterium]
MKHLALLALAVLLTGCASSRIEQVREASTGINHGEAMVILGRASYNEKQTEESFTDCIADALAGGENPIRFIPQEQFKDDLYPWFEPRTAPTSADELGRLFAQPGVQQRINEANVRYLAWIDGDTVTIDSGGSMSCTISTFGGGCFGVSYWEEDASYEASIWDLQTLTSTGQISADATGTSYLAGLVLPIPILARPGNAACKGLANQLREFIVEEG